MTLKQTCPTAWEYQINYRKNPKFQILYLACLHIDSHHCAREPLLELLDWALENEVRVHLNGDVIDGMQARRDPRASFRGTRILKDDKTAYVNQLVSDVVEFLAPYADIIDIYGRGNHEDSIQKNLETDVIDMIVAGLNEYTYNTVYHGGVNNFVRCKFFEQTKSSGKSNRVHRNIMFKHNGGLGISAAKRNKLFADYQNSDVLVLAHTHDMDHHETAKTHLDPKGRVVYKERIMLETPSFEESWGAGDWWDTTNKGPRAMGGWLVTFEAKDSKVRTTAEFMKPWR